MIPVFDYETMQAVDCYAIETMGIDPLKLMEKVALSMWEEFSKQVKPLFSDRFLFLAGSGNNGADSLVMARRAYEAGYHNIEVIIKKEEGSELFQLQLERLRSLSIKITLLADILEAGVDFSQKWFHHKGSFDLQQEPTLSFLQANYLFDGIVGIGTKGDFLIKESDWAILFETLLSSPLKPLFVAVDLPSGLSATHFNCYPMNFTLTVECPKKPFYHPKARSKCGKILLCHAGFPKEALAWGVKQQQPSLFIDEQPSFFLYPLDPTSVHKRSRGDVVLFAGSNRYQGAGVLVSLAASFSGAGFVTLVSHRECGKMALMANAGLVFQSFDAQLFSSKEHRTASYVVGPGWDKTKAKERLLRKILTTVSNPLVLDATALRLIAENRSLLEALLDSHASFILLTPHLGELEALYSALLKHLAFLEKKLLQEKAVEPQELSDWVAFLKEDSIQQKASIEEKVFYLSRMLQSHLLYKGAVSLLCDGMSLYLFDSCRSYLAIAGCGDLLAGIIASLISTQISFSASPTHSSSFPLIDPLLLQKSLLTALQIHALAGDLCYQQEGWFNASQMAHYIGKATAILFPALTVEGNPLPCKREIDE